MKQKEEWNNAIVLHEDAIAVTLLVNSRARETGLLHPASTLLEILKTFTSLGESLG
jgi:hypothetical protein